MSYMRRHRVALNVTVTDGTTQSFFTTGPVAGFVEALRFERASASGLSTNARLTIIGDRSGITILDVTASGVTPETFYPRAAAQDTSRVNRPAVATADTSALWPVRIPVANERVAVQVTSGGTATSPSGAIGNFIDIYISGA